MTLEPPTRELRRAHRTYRFTTSDRIAAHFVPCDAPEISAEFDKGEYDQYLVNLAQRAGFRQVPSKNAPEEYAWLLEPASGNGDLDKLLNDRYCEWAGPLVIQPRCSGTEGNQALRSLTLTYLTHEMLLVIRPPADVEPVLQDAKALGYDVLRIIPYGPPKTYQLRASSHPGYELLDHCDELMRTPGVTAEPILASSAAADAKPTSRNLPGRSRSHKPRGPRDRSWHRKKIGVENAWQKLDAVGQRQGALDVVVAVVDGSFDAPGVPDPRIYFRDYQWFDLRRLSSSLSGAGKPSDLFAGKSIQGHGLRAAGVAAALATGSVPAGAASGCRVRAVVYPPNEIDILDMYVWLAGIDPNSPRNGFPSLLRRPADVVTTSIGFGFSQRMPISSLAEGAFDLIAREGRGGKGTLLFFSAGNGNGLASEERPWATAEPNFCIGASIPDGDEMRRAAYSNHHGVELCAPSSGKSPGSKETFSISSIGRKPFGGTSAATPLAAGVAAMILAARPDLRHDSVRRILRETATKIDLEATGEDACWRNAKNERLEPGAGGAVYSHAYGYGQVNAGSAVEESLTYVQPPRKGDSAEAADERWQEIKRETRGTASPDQDRTNHLLLAIFYFLLYILQTVQRPPDDGDM